MPLLPPLITCMPNDQPLYAPVTGGVTGQVLSQSGNTVSLSGGGGSVDIAITTLVADTATKTTAQSYNAGLLATSFDGDLFVKRTEVGTPLEPQPLSVNGTLDVIIDPTGFVRLTNLASTLASGQNVVYIDPILGTLAQGGAPSGGWVGTATSDLDMAGYNIGSVSSVTNAGGSLALGANGSMSLTSGTGTMALTATDGNFSIQATTGSVQVTSAANTASFGGLETIITSGTNGMTVSAGALLNISSGDGSDTNITSDGNLNLTVAAGLDLTLTNVPAVATLTTHNVGLKATSNGLDIVNYLKVKLGGADIWIPYLTTDPSL